MHALWPEAELLIVSVVTRESNLFCRDCLSKHRWLTRRLLEFVDRFSRLTAYSTTHAVRHRGAWAMAWEGQQVEQDPWSEKGWWVEENENNDDQEVKLPQSASASTEGKVKAEIASCRERQGHGITVIRFCSKMKNAANSKQYLTADADTSKCAR